MKLPQSTLKPEITIILISKNSKKCHFPDFFGIESHNFVNIHPVLMKFGCNDLRSAGFRMY